MLPSASVRVTWSSILLEALDARAEAEAFPAEAAEQDVEQVGTMRGVVRRPKRASARLPSGV